MSLTGEAAFSERDLMALQDPGRSSAGLLGASRWASTMRGVGSASGVVLAHGTAGIPVVDARPLMREEREAESGAALAPGAARAAGAGNRAAREEPDPYRTCFERDRDRVLHSPSFRRLLGKTQVFIFPADHQRTRLTHALEVTQVATGVSKAIGLNVELTEAIALAHDVGHTPCGHYGETAMRSFIPDFHHAAFGADVALAPLNLCAETLDGVRCHSWDLPAPSTLEGEVVAWADRIAYCTHDLEDACRAGIVQVGALPAAVAGRAGTTRREQIGYFIGALVNCAVERGVIGMDSEAAGVLGEMRSFNYENIYAREEAVSEGEAAVSVLCALVEYFGEDSGRIAPGAFESEPDTLGRGVAYVSGMTDRFAFETAVEKLGWQKEKLPRGIDSPYGK